MLKGAVIISHEGFHFHPDCLKLFKELSGTFEDSPLIYMREQEKRDSLCKKTLSQFGSFLFQLYETRISSAR